MEIKVRDLLRIMDPQQRIIIISKSKIQTLGTIEACLKDPLPILLDGTIYRIRYAELINKPGGVCYIYVK